MGGEDPCEVSRLPVAVEVLVHDAPSGRSASRQASASSSQIRTHASASDRGSSGGTSTPLMPSCTSSGMPETRVVTTGVAQAMASTSTFGMPSRSPSSTTRHARLNTDARRYSSKSWRGVSGPSSVTRPSSRCVGHQTADDLFVVARLSGDGGLERHAESAQIRARLDERVEALLRDQPPDAEDPQDGAAARARVGPAVSAVKSELRPWWMTWIGVGVPRARRCRPFVSVHVTTNEAAAVLRASSPAGLSSSL